MSLVKTRTLQPVSEIILDAALNYIAVTVGIDAHLGYTVGMLSLVCTAEFFKGNRILRRSVFKSSRVGRHYAFVVAGYFKLTVIIGVHCKFDVLPGKLTFKHSRISRAADIGMKRQR